MKKMRTITLAALLLLAGMLAAPVRATDAPPPSAEPGKTVSEGGDWPRDPTGYGSAMQGKLRDLLEKKYSDEYERKVKAQTERADESLSSLFRGVFVVFGAVTLMGIFALLRTGKQQRELDRLKADLAAKG